MRMRSSGYFARMSPSWAICSTAAGLSTALSLLKKHDDLRLTRMPFLGALRVRDGLQLLGLLVEIVADGAAGDAAHQRADGGAFPTTRQRAHPRADRRSAAGTDRGAFAGVARTRAPRPGSPPFRIVSSPPSSRPTRLARNART